MTGVETACEAALSLDENDGRSVATKGVGEDAVVGVINKRDCLLPPVRRENRIYIIIMVLQKHRQ